jgi:O-succinylbenzoic acid--CoA ligase
MVAASLPDMRAGGYFEGVAPGPGDLVAIDLPGGAARLAVVAELWSAGAAILPLDARWSPAERAAVLDRAEPAILAEPDGVTVFAGRSIPPATALVMATSGTGGAPRLAELSREAVAAAIESSARALEGTGPWVACLTPAHAGGMLVLLRGVVLGSPVEVQDRFDPSALTNAATGSSLALVPTMLGRMVDEDVDLGRFDTILVGGDALDPRVRAAAESRGARVVCTYGLTETCGGIAYDGQLFDRARARLATDGGIELLGPTLMEGYRSDPAATAAAFTTDGWLRTGDAGRISEDGLLEIDGRIDDLIRSGGEKVWPAEVERAIAAHPGVAAVAVAGRPDPEWGEHVAAWVVPVSPSDPPTLEALRDLVTERLARFKAPRELHVVDRLPRTASGKVRRSSL